jgi:hypothetical protein
MDLTSFLWGAAISAIIVFGTGFLKKAGEDCYAWAKRKINPKSSEPHQPHLIIHMNTDDAPDTAQSISLGKFEHPLLERVSAVTLDEINTAIIDAPPLQRDRVAESYVGLRVEWETLFKNGTLNVNGTIRLHLSVDNAKHPPRSVWCEVPANEYRELGILPEDSKVRVSGEIENVASYGVNLKDARLHIYGKPE